MHRVTCPAIQRKLVHLSSRPGTNRVCPDRTDSSPQANWGIVHRPHGRGFPCTDGDRRMTYLLVPSSSVVCTYFNKIGDSNLISPPLWLPRSADIVSGFDGERKASKCRLAGRWRGGSSSQHVISGAFQIWIFPFFFFFVLLMPPSTV
jgi:hypothetical protein